MSKWDYLLESDERLERLRRRAIQTQDSNDWDNYESALLRSGDVSRMLNRLSSIASMEKPQSIRRLLDKVQGLTGDKVLMVTGLEEKPVGAALREVWIVLKLSGNSLRVRQAISTGLNDLRWFPPSRLDTSKVSDLRFYVVDIPAEQLPRDYVN